MDISIKCNKLRAKYCVNNGMLRCVEPYEFIILILRILKMAISI